MPFIDSKITTTVSEEKKEAIKRRLGEEIRILGKTESYLMVGFEDEYDLYFAGNKVEKGAFVSVKVLGSVNPDACDKMTGAICQILLEELDIPGDKVYVSYQGIRDWGYNGRNF